MPISARILAHSLAPCGEDLFTIEATYPRCIHAEIMTPRDKARNAASSRAIPVEKQIQRVLDDPFVPIYLGKNQAGMQAGTELEEADRKEALVAWLRGRDRAVETAREMLKCGVHKQIVNRIIEPYTWITIIVSGTEWANWDALRDHPKAEPHFQDLARKIKAARAESTPRVLAAGEWHRPLITFDDEIKVSQWTPEMLAPYDVDGRLNQISVGRCGRVSYLTHDGQRDHQKDVELHDRMVGESPVHASAAEHVAQALDFPRWYRALRAEHPDLINPIPRNLDINGNVHGGFARPLLIMREAIRDFRAKHGTDLQAPYSISVYEQVVSQMSSGPFFGFQQYRKTIPNEAVPG